MPDPVELGSGLISMRSTATPASASKMAVAAPAAPAPVTRTLFTAGIGNPSGYLMAMGLTGAPTAPVTGSGAATSRKS